MRNLISVLCLLAAGLLAAATLAGHQVDQLLREEQPVQHIAGSLPEDPAFSAAVTETIMEESIARLPEGVQQFVPGGVENMIRPVISSALDSDRTTAAWDEVLQTTRSDYAAQLEQIFAEGTGGDPRELDVTMDLTPVTDAMTQPLRERLESTLGMVPGLNAETFEVPTPTIEIDLEAATDDSADPYTWATAAAASEHWMIFGISSAVLTALGMVVGSPRLRWIGLASGAALAAGIGLWIATTVAAPSFQQPAGLTDAESAMLEHIQTRFTDWAQPDWWIFTGVAGFVVAVAVLAAIVTPARREH